jgi:uncharacterized protein (DUF1919 family)
MLTFYEENFEIFFVEEKAIKFMEDIGRLQDRPCRNEFCVDTRNMKLYKDKNYLGGYKYTCKSLKKIFFQ